MAFTGVIWLNKFFRAMSCYLHTFIHCRKDNSRSMFQLPASVWNVYWDKTGPIRFDSEIVVESASFVSHFLATWPFLLAVETVLNSPRQFSFSASRSTNSCFMVLAMFTVLIIFIHFVSRHRVVLKSQTNLKSMLPSTFSRPSWINSQKGFTPFFIVSNFYPQRSELSKPSL